LRQLPELEARQFANEFRELDAIERAIADGIRPPGIADLVPRLEDLPGKMAEFEKTILRGINQICPVTQKLDPHLAAEVRRLLGRVGQVAKQLRIHYQHMLNRVQHIAERSNADLHGPVQRAHSLYSEALGSIAGVRDLGTLRVDLRDKVPLYELPISIDPDILNDRRKLWELERSIDDYVEQRDPVVVGMIVFKFEPASGAA
jgi:hypothetical protein